MTILPCGCATCGCACADHSPDRQPRPCLAHTNESVLAAVLAEARALVALALFIGAVALWCAILAS